MLSLGRRLAIRTFPLQRASRALSLVCSSTMATDASPAKKRVLIVGGVAGGASCAARLRRQDEQAEITIFEKGPYVSFANCGLPYYVGDVIKDQGSLLVANAAKFDKWFNVAVKENTEVVSIDRTAKTVVARDVTSGTEAVHPYDYLVLSPGGNAIRPPLPGIDLPGVFSIKTVPEANAIKAWIAEKGVKRAVVVGGGFIGLEMVENLVHRGIACSLVEAMNQVMPPFDPEVVDPVHERLRSKGVDLHLGDAVAGFEAGPAADGKEGRPPLLRVLTKSGKKLDADLVLLVIGVRPETALARQAGLALGSRGGIQVDEQMRTSDPDIFAVGDAVEVRDVVTGEQTLIPLAGPANRQGRIVANVITGNEPSRFRGSQGSSVVGLFGLTLAATGASEKTLKRLGRPYDKVYLHVNNHAGYYPGAKQIDVKLLFDPKDGRVLGMQAAGEEGVEKRVDVVAMAIQKGATVFDLEEAELCYAPQFGSAKDPVNLAGMVAANVLRGSHPLTHWDAEGLREALAEPGAVLVDVREPGELSKVGSVPGCLNLPLSGLRQQLQAIKAQQQQEAGGAEKKYYIYCQVGLRGYLATRQFLQSGLDAVNISGGFKSFQQVAPKL